MKLHDSWQRYEEGVSLENYGSVFHSNLQEAQKILLELEECDELAVSHPLTHDLEYHPVGVEVTTGARMAVRGWRNGGWPLLRLLHGIAWQQSFDRGGLL